jgi:hypothetical protein
MKKSGLKVKELNRSVFHTHDVVPWNIMMGDEVIITRHNKCTRSDFWRYETGQTISGQLKTNLTMLLTQWKSSENILIQWNSCN